MQTVRPGQMARVVELETGMTMTFGWALRPGLDRGNADLVSLASATRDSAEGDVATPSPYLHGTG